jgi:large conductance mechanosensitive channel
MPPIGRVLHGVDFSNLFIALNGKHYDTLAAAKQDAAPTMNYGLFLNSVISFLIVAFCVFLLMHTVNRWTKKPEPAVAPATKECPQCAMTIPINAKKCPYCTTQIG